MLILKFIIIKKLLGKYFILFAYFKTRIFAAKNMPYALYAVAGVFPI
jgi:hypothetical protein